MSTDEPDIPREPIADASAWTGDEMDRSMVWLHHLTPTYIDEIDQVIEGFRRNGKTLETISREDVSLPTFSVFLKRFLWHDIAMRGFGVIRGFPRDRYTDDEIGMLYWGLGFHMGLGVSQNPDGHLLGHVINLGDQYGALNIRGYRTNAALNFHCDPSDVVGLLCLHKAKEGGLSTLVSSATIFNTILAEHPEYLPVLFRGFVFDRRKQNPHFLEPFTPVVPIFRYVDGDLSMRYVRSIINSASEKLKMPFTDLEKAALDFIDEVAHRDGVAIAMDLQEGDMQFANNYLCLHARTAFVDQDDPDRKRHLLRLWLKVPGFRKLAPDFVEYDADSGWCRRDGVLPYDSPPPRTQPEPLFV